MRDSKSIQKIFVLFFLAGLGFFRPKFIGISDSFSRYIFEILAFILFFSTFYIKKNPQLFSKLSKAGFVILITAMFTSIYMAFKFNGQSLLEGFSSTLPYMISYLSLFLLINLNINRFFLEKLIKYFALVTMCLMAINLITYPNILFGTVDISETRGGFLRNRVPGIMNIVFLLFYSIHRYTLFKRKKHIKWIVLCSIFIILTLTRQLILLSSVFGIFLYLKNAKRHQKIIFSLFLIIFSIIIIPQLSIFQSLFSLTKEQLSSNDSDENIRVIAWNYYTVEKQPNASTYFWGTGVPNSNSKYGKDFYDETTNLKVFLVDIGFGGFYYLFGLLGIIGLLIILFSSFFYKEYYLFNYVKSFIWVNLLMSFTSGVVLNKSDVVLLMISIYLLAYKYENSNTDFKLQQSN